MSLINESAVLSGRNFYKDLKYYIEIKSPFKKYIIRYLSENNLSNILFHYLLIDKNNSLRREMPSLSTIRMKYKEFRKKDYDSLELRYEVMMNEMAADHYEEISMMQREEAP